MHSYKMLTVLDEYTREALCVAVWPKMNAHDVLETLHPLLMKHGKPEFIRSDNGPEVNYQMFGNSDKALIVINEIDELDLRSVQPKFREFMDTKRHLIRFVAKTNHKNRMMGAMLSRFRVLDIDPPSKTDWVPRVLSML